jgi:endonuclease YncB( thermonuclease family)
MKLSILAVAVLSTGNTVKSLLVQPIELQTLIRITTTTQPASLIEGNLILAYLTSGTSVPTTDFQSDQVARILDANTIKLKKNGIVSLAGARLPAVGSNFKFPECSTYSPTYKLRQLIPPESKVLVKLVVESGKTQGIILRKEDSLMVNEELIKTGFAKTRPMTSSELDTYLDFEQLKELQNEAKSKGLGIFKLCEDRPEGEIFVADFEPLEFDVETQWGDDGGKQVIKQKENAQAMPENPGDARGCSDFDTYEVC